jgi:hypothetical protein
MKIPTLALALLSALGISLADAAPGAPPVNPLTVTHRVISVEQEAGGHAWLNLDITAANRSASDWRAVTLRALPGPGLLPAAGDDTAALALGQLAAGETRTQRWVLPLAGPVPAELLHHLLLAGEAQNSAGLVTFPVDSEETAS